MDRGYRKQVLRSTILRRTCFTFFQTILCNIQLVLVFNQTELFGKLHHQKRNEGNSKSNQVHLGRQSSQTEGNAERGEEDQQHQRQGS